MRHAAAPVAVLIDRRTTSSGEMAAIALLGRAHVRTFGEPSGGYTTANEPVPLGDGAFLVVTSAFVRDRIGGDYRESIVPDEKVDPAQAQPTAVRWLESACRKPG